MADMENGLRDLQRDILERYRKHNQEALEDYLLQPSESDDQRESASEDDEKKMPWTGFFRIVHERGGQFKEEVAELADRQSGKFPIPREFDFSPGDFEILANSLAGMVQASSRELEKIPEKSRASARMLCLNYLGDLCSELDWQIAQADEEIDELRQIEQEQGASQQLVAPERDEAEVDLSLVPDADAEDEAGMLQKTGEQDQSHDPESDIRNEIEVAQLIIKHLMNRKSGIEGALTEARNHPKNNTWLQPAVEEALQLGGLELRKGVDIDNFERNLPALKAGFSNVGNVINIAFENLRNEKNPFTGKTIDSEEESAMIEEQLKRNGQFVNAVMLSTQVRSYEYAQEKSEQLLRKAVFWSQLSGAIDRQIKGLDTIPQMSPGRIALYARAMEEFVGLKTQGEDQSSLPSYIKTPEYLASLRNDLTRLQSALGFAGDDYQEPLKYAASVLDRTIISENDYLTETVFPYQTLKSMIRDDQGRVRPIACDALLKMYRMDEGIQVVGMALDRYKAENWIPYWMSSQVDVEESHRIAKDTCQRVFGVPAGEVAGLNRLVDEMLEQGPIQVDTLVSRVGEYLCDQGLIDRFGGFPKAKARQMVWPATILEKVAKGLISVESTYRDFIVEPISHKDHTTTQREIDLYPPNPRKAIRATGYDALVLEKMIEIHQPDRVPAQLAERRLTSRMLAPFNVYAERLEKELIPIQERAGRILLADTYVGFRRNEMASRAAKEYGEKGGVTWHNRFSILEGATGGGKTQLSMAVARAFDLSDTIPPYEEIAEIETLIESGAPDELIGQKVKELERKGYDLSGRTRAPILFHRANGRPIQGIVWQGIHLGGNFWKAQELKLEVHLMESGASWVEAKKYIKSMRGTSEYNALMEAPLGPVGVTFDEMVQKFTAPEITDRGHRNPERATLDELMSSMEPPQPGTAMLDEVVTDAQGHQLRTAPYNTQNMVIGLIITGDSEAGRLHGITEMLKAQRLGWTRTATTPSINKQVLGRMSGPETQGRIGRVISVPTPEGLKDIADWLRDADTKNPFWTACELLADEFECPVDVDVSAPITVIETMQRQKIDPQYRPAADMVLNVASYLVDQPPNTDQGIVIDGQIIKKAEEWANYDPEMEVMRNHRNQLSMRQQ
jgi:hypothetical protein